MELLLRRQHCPVKKVNTIRPFIASDAPTLQDDEGEDLQTQFLFHSALFILHSNTGLNLNIPGAAKESGQDFAASHFQKNFYAGNNNSSH